MSDIRTLFATQVYQSSIAEEKGFQTFLAELDQACCFIAEEDTAGHGWCKENAYPGYTSYASLDDLPQRATVFETLKGKLGPHPAAGDHRSRTDLWRPDPRRPHRRRNGRRRG